MSPHTFHTQSLLEFIERSTACHGLEEFESIVRGPLRQLLPHGSLIAAIGHLSFGMIQVEHMLGVDAPAGFVEYLQTGTTMTERKFMTQWYMTRLPQSMDITINPECLSPLERDEVIRYDLRNIAVHGVIDIDGLAASYFSFSRLPTPPDAGTLSMLEHVTPHLHLAFSQSVTLTAPASHPQAPISQREQDLLRLLQQGLSNKQIAHSFKTSAHTVRTQLYNLFTKLGVHNRANAIAKAHEIGLDKLGR